jgi:hypothetical protein
VARSSSTWHNLPQIFSLGFPSPQNIQSLAPSIFLTLFLPTEKVKKIKPKEENIKE